MKLFTASWCAPCEIVKEELAKLHHSVDILDIKDNIAFARASGVRSVPSLVLGNGDVLVGVEPILNALREAYNVKDVSN